MFLRARQFTFEFPRPALVMGIVNATPDSFSDGGHFFVTEKAVAHALELVDQGAELLDVGGESTRPGAPMISQAEELARVIPVIEQLAQRVKVPISIDTMKPAVARASLAAGASIVNDVAAAHRKAMVVGQASRLSGSGDKCEGSHLLEGGSHRTGETPVPLPKAGILRQATKADLQADEMWRVVAESGAGYICMHMQGTPQTMQTSPHYNDVVSEVGEFFQERLAKLVTSGVAAEQVVFDPGIGFGKTVQHNLQLLAAMGSFTRFARPVLLGVSRKSFIGQVVTAEVSKRLPGSLACASLAVQAGVQIIRAHDVAETVQAVRVTEAVMGINSKYEIKKSRTHISGF